MGKSTLVCDFAQNVAMKHQKPVALFSLEMSEMELAHRFIGSQSRISSDRLRKGKVASKDWPKVVKACNQLESAPLWIDDSSDLGLLELRAKARRLHAQERSRGHEGLGLVIVDYLQLMRSDDARANRVEQVAQFSRGLKILASELNVPVIGISQLSRAPEQRPDKRPILSDLRESGAIEQDADLVGFLYRDDYYNEESEDPGRRRADPRQAPQRPGRHRPPRLPRALPQVRRPGPRGEAGRAAGRRGTRPTPRTTRGRRGALSWPLHGRSGERQPCRLGICDGSGWILGPEDVARPCDCRSRMVAQARLRGIDSVIPAKYRGVSFDRPPVTQMDAFVVKRVRDFCERLDENLDSGRGMWFFGSSGTGKTTLAMLISRTALESGRSVAIYSLPKLLSRIRQTYDAEIGEQSYSQFFERLASVDLLHLDDLGVEKQTEWVLEQLYALINERYERQRSLIVTSNLEDDELEKQLGTRVVSRLVEICGDPVLLFDEDRRMRVSADVATLARRGRRLGPRPARPLARSGRLRSRTLIIPWSCLESS